ncbi:MAG: hypothetical protein K2N61_09120 [Lachnospiraceae bacterium]|nr:hypothetical protein [Lachnospiraceae bacterium]
MVKRYLSDSGVLPAGGAKQEMRRYEVCETTDAFEEPYAIWDNQKDGYYVLDGLIQTFVSRKAADRYQRQLSGEKDCRRKK